MWHGESRESVLLTGLHGWLSALHGKAGSHTGVCGEPGSAHTNYG